MCDVSQYLVTFDQLKVNVSNVRMPTTAHAYNCSNLQRDVVLFIVYVVAINSDHDSISTDIYDIVRRRLRPHGIITMSLQVFTWNKLDQYREIG